MEIHSFLLDIIKLIISISIGVLSLSIAFLDKLNIDLTQKSNKNSIVLLWISLVVALMLSIITSIFIYLDVEASERDELIRSAKTKTFFFLTLTAFVMEIGFIVIKRKP